MVQHFYIFYRYASASWNAQVTNRKNIGWRRLVALEPVVHVPSDSLQQHALIVICQLLHHFYIFCRRSVGISGISEKVVDKLTQYMAKHMKDERRAGRAGRAGELSRTLSQAKCLLKSALRNQFRQMDDGGRRQQPMEQQLLQAIQQMADAQGKPLPWASNKGPS